jgi:hypothetical protein
VPAVAAPPPNMQPARPKPPAKPGDGHITVASEPRCEVLVDGVPYGATPLIDLAVPAGRHNVVLLNSAAGVRESVKVALREGELWTRSFSFENGKMSMQNGLSAKMLAASAHEAAPSVAPAAAAAPKTEAPAAHPAAKPAAPAPVVASAPPPSAPRPVEGAASSKPAAAPAAVASMAPQKPRNVNARTLDGQQLSHAEPHLPDIIRIQRRGTGDARFAAKVCVNNDGKVYQVNVLSGIPGADDSIVNTIKSWTYKPQPVSVCFVQSIVYDLQ